MRRVAWSRQARSDLIAIQLYVSVFNRSVSIRLARRLIEQAESLAHAPERGRPVGSGVRELTAVRPYVIRYSVSQDEVQIVTIRHSGRRPEL
jgi:plasmid stabilization system protein ParE